MGADKINRDSAMPLYLQIAADLRKRIISGEWPADRPRMPSQKQLAAEYGVNRLTVGKAVALLREDGLAVTWPDTGTDAVMPG